ncbi:MAG: glycosyltransferase family 2 protein [Alphaproteobacteria bacterium]|nr:glycosyltransferase family 2 protein [Alphaproteobacteria bacterium]
MSDIDIGICTFRRAHLAQTLCSLSQLDLPRDCRIRIIVADNDETPSARDSAEKAAHEYGLDMLYLHAPARNISVARNACLNAATAPLLAYIDDDEEALPGWLVELLKILEAEKADVALGPVRAVYGDDAPAWARAGDFHSTKPVWVRGKIVTGYSCNALFRRLAPAVKGKAFSPELGRSGGEDTAFFAAIHREGGRIAYAPSAIVTETVPASRASLRWLLARRFRSGQTHGLLLAAEASFASRLANAARATAKSLFCALCAAGSFYDSVAWRRWLLRGALHAGVVARLLGKRELTLY